MESPIPNQTKPKTLSFPEAMQEVINGKRITRLEWGNENEYAVLKDGILRLHTSTDNYKEGYWGIRDVDMKGEDWISISVN